VVCLKKVSLYLDERLWARFKEVVLGRHGTLRKLSNEVEGVIRSSIVDEEYLKQAFKMAGANLNVSISSEELRKVRPKLRGPPSEVLVRGMRRARFAESVCRQ